LVVRILKRDITKLEYFRRGKLQIIYLYICLIMKTKTRTWLNSQDIKIHYHYVENID
jgi:hypothetical protein